MMVTRLSLVLGLVLLATAVMAWTGLEGDLDDVDNPDPDYNIENILESEETDEELHVGNGISDEDTGNGHSDDDNDDQTGNGHSDSDDDDQTGNGHSDNVDDDETGNGHSDNDEEDAITEAEENNEAEFVDPSQFVG